MSCATNEVERLRALKDLHLLDTPPSEAFDRITRLVAAYYEMPIAAISLTDKDRQWFKSRVGTTHTELPREQAPCAEVTGAKDLLIVPDLTDDPRFANTELTRRGGRFYAGAPLVTRAGHVLGALCVIDGQRREMTTAAASVLADMASMVMDQIELQHSLGRLDPATGLPNRYQFCEDLEDLGRDLERASEWPECNVILLDLEDPDILAAGARAIGPQHLDEMVRSAVSDVRAILPDGVQLYQVAPTQFTLMVRTVGQRDTLVAELSAMINERAIGNCTRTTLGVVVVSPDVDLPEDILRRAHAAAQDARDAQVKVAIYTQEMDTAHQRRFQIIRELRRTLDAEGQLSVVFQPRVELATGACRSLEALLRWTHPDLGTVSPGEFIPLAEASSLVRPVTGFVVDAALEQAAAWRAAGTDLAVSINVSVQDLEAPGFVGEIRRTLARHGLGAEALELEFTESALIRDKNRVLRALEAVRALGIRVAIDDFGTGYSSFAYLKDLPADTIKIDQSFIRTLVPGDRQSGIVSSVIEMAHGLGLRAVAEGVETAEALSFLAEAGCDEVQGYHLCRPLPASDVSEWLARWAGDGKAAA